MRRFFDHGHGAQHQGCYRTGDLPTGKRRRVPDVHRDRSPDRHDLLARPLDEHPRSSEPSPCETAPPKYRLPLSIYHDVASEMAPASVSPGLPCAAQSLLGGGPAAYCCRRRGVLTGSGTTREPSNRKYYDLYNLGDLLGRVHPTAGRGTPDRRHEGFSLWLFLRVLR